MSPARRVDRSEQTRSVRASLGLSQEAFAGLIGTSFVSVNRWESGKSSPSSLWGAVLDLLESATRHAGAATTIRELRAIPDEPGARLIALARLGR